MRLTVVILAGLHADVARETANRMLAERPGRTVVVEHDLRELAGGRVVRTLRDENGSQHLVVDLAHGCVGCTLRESVLPALAECARHERYRTVILALPPGVEPEPVTRELTFGSVGRVPMRRIVTVHAVVTALDPALLIADADGAETLAHRGLACAPTDDRFVSEVLIRQIEHADVLVGPAASAEPASLLAQLNPSAALLPPHRAGGLVLGPSSHDPRAAARRADPGAVPTLPSAGPGPASSFTWRGRRPLHPGRFYAGLEQLVPAVLRTRGHVWLASRPDTRYALATSGPRVQLISTGSWPDGNAVFETNPSDLGFTGLDMDADRLSALLDWASLTSSEYAAGPGRWKSLPDPFTPALRAATGA